jgi:hypothetical protein
MSVEIKYWEKESWINYLRNDVLQLYELSAAILYLWNKLRDIANGKLLSDVKKLAPELELMFVAGTSPPDKYEEGGLALIYKSLLGTSIKLREYYFLKSLNKEPKTLCNVERSRVVDYLDHILVLLERALQRACELNLLTYMDIQIAQERSKVSAEEVLNRPGSISEVLVELLNKALNLTIAYNEHTRFVWHLRKIPKKYIKEFYPELLKPEVFKFVQELLGLREYIVPRVEDAEIVDLYTIYSFDHTIRISEKGIDDVYSGGYSSYLTGDLPPRSTYEPYETIGGCLCRVNELIWGLFRNGRSHLRLVVSGELPDPFEDWVKATESVLPCEFISLKYPKSYEDLSMLDECLPAVFVGRIELIMIKGGELYLIRRW